MLREGGREILQTDLSKSGPESAISPKMFLSFAPKGSKGELKAGPNLSIHKCHIIGMKGLIFAE